MGRSKQVSLVKMISRQEAALKVAKLGLKYARMMGRGPDTQRIHRWTAIEKAVLEGDDSTIGWLLSAKALIEFEEEMNQVAI